MKKIKGFTFIEVIVVMLILGMLGIAGIGVYKETPKDIYTRYYKQCLEEAELSVKECKLNAEARSELLITELD